MEFDMKKEIHLLMESKDKRKILSKILAGYELPVLVKIAAVFDIMIFRSDKYPKTDLEFMLKVVLRERKRRINAKFQWKDETRKRFLLVNDQLYEACVKGWQEALETAAALEVRIKREDSFLKDYEITVNINAYPKINGDRDDVVTDYFAVKGLNNIASISHCHYETIVLSADNESFPKLCIDKTTNWNGEYFNGEFDNDYICYAIHRLLDSHMWSFQDILSIRRIWIDVEATHQHFSDIPKGK